MFLVSAATMAKGCNGHDPLHRMLRSCRGLPASFLYVSDIKHTLCPPNFSVEVMPKYAK